MDYFIDSNPLEKEFDNVPIISAEKLNSEITQNRTIIVIPTYDMESITDFIKKKCGEITKILSLETILEN